MSGARGPLVLLALGLAGALAPSAGCARTPAGPPVAPAAPSPPAAADPCAGAPVCDDFERYAPGSAPAGPWTVSASPGEAVVVDGARAASGARAVLVRHTGTAHAFVYLQIGRPVLPLPANDLHGRLMLYVTRTPPRLHWDVIRGSGPLPAGGSAQYNVGGQTANFLSNYEPHDCWRKSQVPFPQGRWACIQWRFDGAAGGADGGTRNGLSVWLDGAPIADAAVERFGDGCVDKTASEWVAPRFDTLSIGWEQYRPSDPIEMWVDDVAIGDRPIACPQPARR
jgi:hypothetical protein